MYVKVILMKEKLLEVKKEDKLKMFDIFIKSYPFCYSFVDYETIIEIADIIIEYNIRKRSEEKRSLSSFKTLCEGAEELEKQAGTA